MKFVARLVAVALTAAALMGVAPAFAAESDPLVAWKNALANSGTGQANVVYLGSSTTYGTGASSPEKRYVNVLTDRLRGTSEPVPRAGSSSPVRNTAPGLHGYVSAARGVTSENYVNDSTRPWILWEKPSLIVHMIGSNDSLDYETYAVTAEEYEANVAAEIDRLDAGSTQPISHVLVHTYRRAGVSMEKWATYRAALERIASGRDNVLVVDISAEYEAVDHLGADPLDLLGTDGAHQTDAGHAFMADLLAPVLAAPVPAPTEPEPAQVVVTPGATGTTTPESVPVPVPTATAPTPVEADAPNAPRRVRAVRDGRRTKVAWRKVVGADAYEVRCGPRVAKVTGGRAVVRAAARRCSVRSVSEVGTSAWVRVTVRRHDADHVARRPVYRLARHRHRS